MSKPSLLILAAGMGSRYGGLKQMDQMGPSGETIMDYSVYDALEAGFGKIVFVIRKSFRREFEQKICGKYGGKIELAFAEQELDKIPQGMLLNPDREKPWGTGHAVLVANEFINTPFAVINADDYYGQHSFKILADYLNTINGQRGAFSMVGFKAGNTLSESGSVSRGICTTNKEGFLESVEEHHNISRDNSGVITGENSSGDIVKITDNTYVSMNMWGFTPDLFQEGNKLFSHFMQTKGNELKSEFYIPYVVNKLLESGYAKCKVLTTPDSWFGVTYKEDRQFVSGKVSQLVKEGKYPTPLF
jgi:dTDP-glucose pyrophosphorylase